MPTMTVTIPDAPGFAAVKEGYTFSGTVSLPETVNAPIKINSISLYYNYGRRYVRYVYLTATCGDTTFQTNYFSLQADESLKKITVACSNITAGSDHLLKQNGRPITFKVACDYSTSGVVVDRARGGEMTLTINYEILFEKSPYTLSSDLIDLGQSLVLNVEETALNADYAHKAVLDMAGLQVTGERTGPGEILLEIPRDAQWLAQIPDTVQKTGTVTLTTEGSGETGTEEKTLMISVPADVVPVITKSTIQRIDGRVPAAWGLYAQGESAALLTIDEAVAGEGSSIAGYRIEGAGFAANDRQLQTGKLLLTGYQTFRLTVTDARGRTGGATYEIYVHPYAQPALAAFEAQRANDDGAADDSGVKIAGRAEYTIANIGENAPAFTIYADGQVTEPEILQAEDGLVAFLLTGPYDQAHSVEVTLEIRDGITAASVTAGSLTDLVPTANVAMNLKRGGTAVAFGRYAETEKTLAIPEDWRYYRGETDIEQKADDAKAAAVAAAAAAAGKLGKDETAADSLKLGGKFPVYYLTPVNVLDNGDFTNPINQRGETSYTAEGYTIDRWRLWGSDNAVTVNDGYVSVTGVMQQYLETYDPEMTYTLAACNTAGEVFCVSGTFGDEAAKADWGELAYSTDYSLANVALRTKDWVWAAVYEGEFTAETLPPYVPKGYTAELLECQRYAYRPPEKSTHVFPGYCASTSTAYFRVQTPVPMRASPTLIIAEPENVQIFRHNGTTVATAVTLYSFERDSVVIRATVSGMTAWSCVTGRFNTKVLFDSELV